MKKKEKLRANEYIKLEIENYYWKIANYLTKYWNEVF